MKVHLAILSSLFIAVMLPGTTFALNPDEFLHILNVDIRNCNAQAGRFLEVQKVLGKTNRTDRGDAAGYVGSVDYVLRNGLEIITFSVTECTYGYRVRHANVKERSGKTVMKSKVKHIGSGGLRLEMPKKNVEALFAGAVEGGWSRGEAKNRNGTMGFCFHKTIDVKDYDGKFRKHCDHIWIDLTFDSKGKLGEFNVTAGGCDDAPCGSPP